MTSCKICDAPTNSFGIANLLGKYEVEYFECTNCGFLQPENPHIWLEEVYAKPISVSDVGYVRRNMQSTWATRALLMLFFNKRGRFLDYGGGYGLFTRLMRDTGFDFLHYEKYCQNLFAQTFELEERSDQNFELVTVFEVFEHFVDPWEDLTHILNHSRNVFFSTELIPPSRPALGEWWYYGLEHGQHISFYTRRSLEILAERAGLNFTSDGQSLHLFSEEKLPNYVFKFLARYKILYVLGIFLRRRSLFGQDSESVKVRQLEKIKAQYEITERSD